MWIKLHSVNSQKEVFIQYQYITCFYPSEIYEETTVIKFIGGDTIFVKETMEDIEGILNNIRNDMTSYRR